MTSYAETASMSQKEIETKQTWGRFPACEPKLNSPLAPEASHRLVPGGHNAFVFVSRVVMKSCLISHSIARHRRSNSSRHHPVFFFFSCPTQRLRNPPYFFVSLGQLQGI